MCARRRWRREGRGGSGGGGGPHTHDQPTNRPTYLPTSGATHETQAARHLGTTEPGVRTSGRRESLCAVERPLPSRHGLRVRPRLRGRRLAPRRLCGQGNSMSDVREKVPCLGHRHESAGWLSAGARGPGLRGRRRDGRRWRTAGTDGASRSRFQTAWAAGSGDGERLRVTAPPISLQGQEANQQGRGKRLPERQGPKAWPAGPPRWPVVSSNRSAACRKPGF